MNVFEQLVAQAQKDSAKDGQPRLVSQGGGSGGGRTQISESEVLKDLLSQTMLSPITGPGGPSLTPQARQQMLVALGINRPPSESLNSQASPTLGPPQRSGGAGRTESRMSPPPASNPQHDYWRRNYDAEFDRKQREKDALSQSSVQNRALEQKFNLIKDLLGGMGGRGNYDSKVTTSGSQGQYINNAGQFQLVNSPSSQTTTTYGNYQNDIRKALLGSLLG